MPRGLQRLGAGPGTQGAPSTHGPRNGSWSSKPAVGSLRWPPRHARSGCARGIRQRPPRSSSTTLRPDARNPGILMWPFIRGTDGLTQPLCCHMSLPRGCVQDTWVTLGANTCDHLSAFVDLTLCSSPDPRKHTLAHPHTHMHTHIHAH